MYQEDPVLINPAQGNTISKLGGAMQGDLDSVYMQFCFCPTGFVLAFFGRSWCLLKGSQFSFTTYPDTLWVQKTFKLHNNLKKIHQADNFLFGSFVCFRSTIWGHHWPPSVLSLTLKHEESRTWGVSPISLKKCFNITISFKINIFAHLDVPDAYFEVVIESYWCQQLPWHQGVQKIRSLLLS